MIRVLVNMVNIVLAVALAALVYVLVRPRCVGCAGSESIDGD